jgi:hypothetical protein
LPGAVVEWTTPLKVAPYRHEECTKRELDFKSTLFPGKVKRQVALLFPRFQAFLYALAHTAERSLRSDSGQSMSGAEKEEREGRRIEMTFSL